MFYELRFAAKPSVLDPVHVIWIKKKPDPDPVPDTTLQMKMIIDILKIKILLHMWAKLGNLGMATFFLHKIKCKEF